MSCTNPSVPTAKSPQWPHAVFQGIELIDDKHGSQMFIHGLRTNVWDAWDWKIRRFAAVNVLTLPAAGAGDCDRAQ